VPKPRVTTNSLELLLALLDEAYHRKSWHGTNLRGSLRGLSAADAVRRTAASRHNIAEVVLHCAYWKYTVRRRLLDEPRGGFPLSGSDWFPVDAPLDDKTWKQHLRLLKSEHDQLRAAVDDFDPRRLPDLPPNGSVPYDMLIRGVALHDVYHAGQIQLIKRADVAPR
jgi:uncharacterized damage-inducible protein DinB